MKKENKYINYWRKFNDIRIWINPSKTSNCTMMIPGSLQQMNEMHEE